MTARRILHGLSLLLLASCLADDSHYFESVSYSIETSQMGISMSCKMQVVSLRANLSSVNISIPYSLGDLLSEPIVMVGKRVVVPTINSGEHETLLTVDLGGMKLGQLESITLRYIVRGGMALGPGSKVEVRTLGLGGGATGQTLGLKLPKGLTISRIETPYGSIRPRKSGASLRLGAEPTRVVLVVRRTNLLDNKYATWVIALAIVAGPAVLLFRRWHRKRKLHEAEVTY